MGVGADDPDREGWVAILHRRLPPGTRLLRLGVSGSTALEAVEQQVPLAEAARPQIVTIWLGVNDFRAGVPLSQYRSALDEIVRRMTALRAAVFLGNLPDLAGIPEFAYRDPDELRLLSSMWNATIEDVARSRGAVLVDLKAASEEIGSEETGLLIADDGYHPNTLGHIALAEIFLHYVETTIELSGLQ